MNYISGMLLCCALTIVTNPVTLADTEDKSEEVVPDQDITLSPIQQQNENASAEVGPLDSHEAMNNREINPQTRDKRSYEFLMGLVNNNSKYEITKLESLNKQQSDGMNAGASELLLELLVKIAAHPDYWREVHELLKRIEGDLNTSKKIVERLQQAKIAPQKESKMESVKKQYPAWPRFEDEPLVNTVPPEHHLQSQHKHIYPKTFAYHRVTGRPLYLNKNPKAYIAVSVIAPKPMNLRSKEEDLTLEKELRQLKPWTHNQNLKNMASIRSRWVIQTDDEKKVVAP